MKVNKNELLKALNLVKPGLAKSEGLEQMDSFFFIDKSIRSFNDEIQVSVDFYSGIEGAVHPLRFYSLLSKIPDEELLIVQKDNKVIVKGKLKKATFSLSEISEELIHSLINTEEINRWRPLPKDFIDALKFCYFSALDRDKENILSCLYINNDKIISSDDIRVTVKNMESDSKTKFLIPKESVKELVKYNPIKFNRSSSWINFKNKEGVIFSSRIIEGEFPDISNIIKIKNGIDITLPDNLEEVLNRAEIMSEDDLITISLSKGKITCKGNCDYGEYEETTKAKYSGEDIFIQVNPILMKEIIPILNTMKLDNAKNKIVFEGKDFTHVMAVKGSD